MQTLVLPKPRTFDLDAHADFYRGFTPGSGMAASSEVPNGKLTLSFRADGSYAPVVVRLEEGASTLTATFVGDVDPAAVRAQISRILGLEVDGEAWRALGRDDALVGRLQAEFPGFFTAAKSSPWDAAAWSILSQRINMKLAAKIKIEMGRVHGDALTLDGVTHGLFPSPMQILGIDRFPGVPEEKIVRLRGLAEAALEGRLDANRLLAMGEEAALADLMELRGIGPWAASHIYYRGAAPIDALPVAEPRVLEGLASAMGTPTPSTERYRNIAEAWRPFRMWVCVLLARHLARAGGWKKPGLARARAAAGRQIPLASAR